MTHSVKAAPDPVSQADQYIASLFHALGPRDPLEVMAETAPALRDLTAGVDRARLTQPEAPGKWSMVQVIQHLADSEIVGAFRYRMILAHDRPPIPGYDQDLWASRLRYQNMEVEDALQQFSALRQANLRLLRSTTPEEKLRVGIHAERGEESIDKNMRLYAGHDLVHLRQLARVKSAVGA